MIYTGDCRDVMKTFEPNSIDCVVTDPPYGLGFMGKDWDHGIPGKEFWDLILKAAKPGAFLLAFGGTRTFHRLTCAIEDAGFEIRDCMMWLYGSGFPKSHNLKGEWEGYGTALKPAWEPIIVARKPLEGTVAQNVLKWGTGAMNIDGGRIATTDKLQKLNGSFSFSGSGGANETGKKIEFVDSGLGRWPANVILDEESGRLVDEQSGISKSTGGRSVKRSGGTYVGGNGDTGGASRFFYCAKTSKKERGAENNHPTVKPQALMSYLIKLVCPPKGIVLDPFMGSGSTGIAAVKDGFSFIGIEKEAAYVEIASKRIGAI